MKTILTLFCALFLLVVVPAQAQVTINSTTFSSNVAPTDDVISLTATTCTGCTFGAGTMIVAAGEVMTVAGTYSSGSSNIPVIRNSRRAYHNTAETVWVGDPVRFERVDAPAGACVKSGVRQFDPWINLNNGFIWFCDNGQTVPTAIRWRVVFPYATSGTSPS